jgi:predicted transcriptional regulator
MSDKVTVMQQITVKFEDEKAEALKEHARSVDRPVSWVVRHAVSRFLYEQRPKLVSSQQEASSIPQDNVQPRQRG